MSKKSASDLQIPVMRTNCVRLESWVTTMVRIEDWQKGSQDLKCFVCGMIFRMTWNLRNHMTKDTKYHCHENVLFVEYLFQKSEIWEITWKELLTWRTCQGRAILLPQILLAVVGSISRQGRASAWPSRQWRHSRQSGSWCHDEKIVNENIRYGSE